MKGLSLRALGVVLLLTALVYARAFVSGFVTWDDNVIILENAILRMPFREAMQHAFGGFYHGDYFPLTLLSFWVDVKLFGLQARPYHVENLILHVLNVFLVGRLFKHWKLPDEIRWVSLCLFAWHPVQVESVLWISERKGLLSTFFLLTAMAFAVRLELGMTRKQVILHRVAYGFFYVLAFLSKSTVFLFPLVLLIRERGVERRSWRELIGRHAPVLAIGIALSIYRIDAYRLATSGFDEAAANLWRWIQLPWTMLAALGFYLRILFWPVNLSIVYPVHDLGRWSFELALGLFAVLFVIWEGRRRQDPRYWTWAAWSLAFLLPVLQIVPRLNYVNDRYLYLPIIGILPLLGILAEPFFEMNKKWLGPGLVLTMAILAFLRTDVWTSNEKLWTDTVRKNPDNGLAHANLAAEYQSQGRVKEAVALYNRVLVLGRADATDTIAYNNLAILLLDPSRHETFNPPLALQVLEQGLRSLQRAEDEYALRYNLGLAYLRLNENAKAIETFRRLEQTLSGQSNQRYVSMLMSAREQLQRIPSSVQNQPKSRSEKP